MDVVSKQTKQIWSNNNNSNTAIRSYAFDDIGGQVVFLTQSKTDVASNTIWYYKQGMQSAEIKVSNEILHRNDQMFINSSAPSFSKNGKYIFFELQRASEVAPTPDSRAVQVDVWNHKDLVLQPLQQYFSNQKQDIPQRFIKTKFTSAIEVVTDQVRQLENDSITLGPGKFDCGDYVMTSYQNTGDKRKRFDVQKVTYYLTSLDDGRQKGLTNALALRFYLSPDRRFLVYFDSQALQYMSYSFENDIIKNISGSIPVKLTGDETEETIEPNTIPAGIAGWLDNGNLLIRDNYDIWVLDPSGDKAAENITGGYGRAHNIKFDLIVDVNGGLANENAIISSNKPLLLSGFWEYTKQNGFYKLEINKGFDSQTLSIHDCIIYASGKQTSGSGPLGSKVKAASANVWIVKKQTITDAPNFFLTSDFKSFRQLTGIQPQKKYRWGANQLLTWKMPDGRLCQGILYKPEDFDSSKRYPVIVYYYEKVSGGLHQFLMPALSNGALNIPWFVSRGYLVFVPDIHYAVGTIAKSVVNSVLPGVQQLLKLPFIDSSAIGIQGHSFGGSETNILITETNLFAAAVEGAGSSDLISKYGSLLPTENFDGQGSFHLERGGQDRMNSLLWEDKAAYIENSSIFKADKVTTPLLIMHNKADQSVPWGQAVELFIALRRLEKPVWMLQYDKGGHGVRGTKDQMDFTTRMTQFFEHYLKGAPAPKWMTEGIPATRKGIVTGYELDPAGSCALNGINECKVCKEWNKQYARTPEMFSKPETEWHLNKDLQISGK
jgi:dipeptidyl aminopeptidase/acylaminoacyl peptidase